MERVQKIIDTYAKMVDLMQGNLPDGIQVCFAIHVSDAEHKDEQNPAGYEQHMFRYKATPLQRTHFKMMINEYFTSINDDE